MGNLQNLDSIEMANLSGGGFYDIGKYIGKMLGDWGTRGGRCGYFSDSEIIGSASNNYVS